MSRNTRMTDIEDRCPWYQTPKFGGRVMATIKVLEASAMRVSDRSRVQQLGLMGVRIYVPRSGACSWILFDCSERLRKHSAFGSVHKSLSYKLGGPIYSSFAFFGLLMIIDRPDRHLYADNPSHQKAWIGGLDYGSP